LQSTIGNQAVQRLLFGPGEPLSRDARAAMESRFGYDLSEVRIHPNDQSATDVGAKAFTNGRHIAVSSHRSPLNARLLSHEIAHVVQQATGEATGLAGAGGDRRQRDALEAKAAESARSATPTGSMAARSLVPLPDVDESIVQFDFEEDVLAELHRMPSAEEEGLTTRERRARTGKLRDRVERLLVLFYGLSESEAKRVYARLRARKKGDRLSERFHDMLSTPTRQQLLAILKPFTIETTPFEPLKPEDMCAGQKCIPDEDLQPPPEEARGPEARSDLSSSTSPRKGSKELKKGRMEWALEPPKDKSPAHLQVTFTPKSSYASHTVTFLQTLLEGDTSTIASQKTVMDYIRDVEQNQPFYGAQWDAATKQWKPVGAPKGYKNQPSSRADPSAYMYDEPVIHSGETRVFESAAVVPETTEILGSLRWGITTNTILGAEFEDCTDLPSASFDKLMTAYYTPRTGQPGGGETPEHYDAVLDGYAADAFALTTEHTRQLADVLQRFRDNKASSKQLAVSGFADAKDEDPMFTSEARATLVMRYFIDNGVAADKIDVHYFGAAWARFPAGPSEDRNRRVQVRIYYK
jgi:hypothetical protein